METLESLRRRIESAEDLLSVVKTMKTVAAASINQYERAVASLAEYNRVIELGFQVTLRNRPEVAEREEQAEFETKGPWGVVVFGSDQGLCGQFNENIAKYTVNKLNGMHIPHDDRRTIVVGHRAAIRMRRAGQELEAVFPVPGSVEGITALVQRLLVHIAAWRSEQEVGHVVLMYNRSTSRIAYEANMVQLFPIESDLLERAGSAAWASRRLPVIFMEWEELFRRLNRQYFFVTLYRAMAESLASEHAARLSSMQAAESNIEEHLDEFSAAYQQQRQKVITSELLDIVSGFEALVD